MASMARYTRLVLFGKNFLSLMAIGIIILVIWIASGNNSDNGGRMIFTSIQKTEETQNIMKNPHYYGVDTHNRPYTIIAETGMQKDKDNNIVTLNKIYAEMTSDNGAWMALNSGYGEMNMGTKQVELSQNVEVFYEGGYQFRTKAAHVDIGKGFVQGNSHVEGQGGAGTVEADSFTILERGNIIKFNGSVRMLLYK